MHGLADLASRSHWEDMLLRGMMDLWQTFRGQWTVQKTGVKLSCHHQ